MGFIQLSSLESVKIKNKKIRAVFLLDEANLSILYGNSTKLIDDLVDIQPVAIHQRNLNQYPELLENAEVALAGWGTPVLDMEFFKKAPRLKAVFYAGGSIRSFVTSEVWKRNIVISSAYGMNAIPVAEYTLATILLSLKHFWKLSAEAKAGLPWGDHKRTLPGCFKSTVGLVSAGQISRLVLQKLRQFDMERIIYCPYLNQEKASCLGARLVSLEEVFEDSDVVSLHTPLLDATRGMIGKSLLERMKPGATLINTARGGIINEKELIEVLQKRTDLTAVLDVTEKEPPDKDSLLLQLPNIILTPHIGGSQGAECLRLGWCMTEELNRYLNHEPLVWRIHQDLAENLA